MAYYSFYGCDRKQGWRWVMVGGKPSVKPANQEELMDEGVEFPTDLFAEAHAQYLAQHWFMDVEWYDRSQPSDKQYTWFDVDGQFRPWPRGADHQNVEG